MILQPIKHASLLLLATIGLMGCLYLTQKKTPQSPYKLELLFRLSGWQAIRYLFTKYSRISTRPQKVWSYAAAVGRKVGWTTIFGNCMRE